MAIEDYLAALFGGQTGTDDPARAGISFPSLIGSAQAAEPSRPTPGYLSPESGAMPAPPPIPGPLSPPPPIPDAMSMPTGTPQAPGPQMQPGGAKILARLYNPEPIQAPGGDDISRIVNLIGPQSGPYAAMQQTARNAQMAGQQPAAPPIPQQPAAAAPAPMTMQQQSPQQQGGIGGNIQSHISELKSNPDFQRVLPPSTKPGFYDNLLRFGLAAMAAGGKPGSNTLGALGEAGLSTFDNSQKAGQADFENALAARKVGIQAQDQISKAYERLDGLKQRSEDTRLSIEQRAEAARQANILHAQIAQMTNQLGRDRLDETSAANADRASDRADKTEDRRAAEARRIDDLARQTQRDTDIHERDLITQQKADMTAIGKTPAQQKMERWSQLDPESRQGKAYAAFEAKRPEIVAQAQRAAASGRPKAAINKQLQDLGYDPLP